MSLLFSYAARGLQAVQLRQANVQESDIRLKRGCRPHGLQAIVSRVDLVAHHAEQPAQAVGSVLVIIYNQNAALRHDGNFSAASSSPRPARPGRFRGDR